MRGDESRDGGITQRGDVVDHARTGFERGADRLGPRGVRGDRHGELGGKELDGGHEARSFLGLRDLGRQVRRRRARPHVDQGGAGIDHGLRRGEHIVQAADGTGMEGLRAHVDHAHDSHRKAVTHRDSCEVRSELRHTV